MTSDLELLADKRAWIAQLDGLRAVAVMAVVIHHFNSQVITGFALGNVAVGVFFGISGFLAHYVLHRDETRWGAVNCNWFMTRRALRIWPLYFFAILSILVLKEANGNGGEIKGIIPLFSFTQNMEMARWGTWAPGELTPLWSISVEEQFYLVAPIVYLLLNSRFAFPFAAVVVVLANMLRISAVASNSMTGNGGVYYASYAYADVFLAGMIVARLNRVGLGIDRSPWWSFGPAAVLLLITMRVWGVSVFPPYAWYAPVPYAVLPIAVGLLLWAILDRRRFLVPELLSHRYLTTIGTLSYGMYVVHLFVLYDFKPFIYKELEVHEVGALWDNLVGIVLVVLLAACLYGLIERPFLRLKDAISPKPLPVVNPGGVPWAILIPTVAISVGLLYQVAGR